MSAKLIRVGGAVIGSGLGFAPGHWKADAPTGTPLPEPPKPERPEDAGTVSEHDRRRRDARTAQNLAAKADALAPRRWRPS